MNVEVVNLAQIVRGATESLRLAAKARQVELVLSLNDANLLVEADPDRLQQAIWNLVGNAIKFSRSGSQVEILSREHGDVIDIQVIDHGQGIDSSFLPYVFDRFRQEDGSLTRGHGGLGLGLAIVRHIVELHGGQVSAASEGRGQGATFTLALPILKWDKSKNSRPLAGHDASHERPRILDDVNVLVVDDEPDTLHLIATILKRSGAQVTLARSAREALELCVHHRPDVLISDIAMPEMDGYEFLLRLRSIERSGGSHTPAAALTAHVGSNEKMQALAAGFEEHMAKPVEPKQLIEVVTHLARRNTTPLIGLPT